MLAFYRGHFLYHLPYALFLLLLQLLALHLLPLNLSQCRLHSLPEQVQNQTSNSHVA